MGNIITKLQSCTFMDESDVKYLEDLESKIVDPEKSRKLFCTFEAINKIGAIKMRFALEQLGFEAYVDEFDERSVEANKEVSYANVKNALNLAMYEAWKKSCQLTSLMLEQDITPKMNSSKE